jgi:hypothetical protein
MKKLLIPILILNSTLLYSNEDLSYLDKLIQDTNDYREGIHTSLMDISSSLDNYISDKEIDRKEYYPSYALIELGVSKTQNESIKFHPKIKIKLKLPKLKDKFRLEFESDEVHQSTNFIEDSDKNKTNDYNLGIGYFKEFKNAVNLNTKVGIKLRSNLDPFIKLNMYKTWNSSQGIDYTLNQEIKVSVEEELESTSSLLISKELDEKYSLHNYSEYYWQSENKEDTQLSSSVYLNDKIDNMNNLTYSLNSNVDNIDSNLKLKRFSLKIKYRHLLKEWLYTDVIPENFYKEDLNFKPRYALRLNLGMYLNKTSYKNRKQHLN